MTVVPRLALLAALLSSSVFAAQIGTIPPAQALTAERVAALPAAERAAWADYLARSDAQRAADRAALAAERKGLATWPAAPAGGNGAATMPLDKPADWYASDAALLVARNIVSYQTPAGGWGKNQPRNVAPRAPGQSFVADNSPAGASDAPWNFVGTIDNDATITEIRFLARVAAAHPGAPGEAWRQAAQRGVAWLLAAQYPRGGWPQVWPLQGGYHDAITLNDNALVAVAELMGAVARGEAGLDVLPAAQRAQAAAAEARAVQLLLDTQVRVNGKLTLWAQQYDPLTQAPSSARNYEPSALSSGESTKVLALLMSLPEPSPAVIEAVRAGVAMLKQLAVHDRAWVMVDAVQGKRLVEQPGAGPLWSRYYDPVTLKPVFGDRDRSLHDDVHGVSAERRRGYAWWGNWSLKTLAAYDAWAAKWVRP
ncbi:pectate lyase [Roseateles sp. LYH14W]|uniref:Pectate lyase n=1 Tax=Pelomonas parva TaxID=3299032 RepID=A0ABW7EXQ5_9BURK